MKHISEKDSNFIVKVLTERKFKNVPDWIYDKIDLYSFSEIMGILKHQFGRTLNSFYINDDMTELLDCVVFIQTLRKHNTISIKDAVGVIVSDIFDSHCDYRHMVLAYYLCTETDWKIFAKHYRDKKSIQVYWIKYLMDLVIGSYDSTKIIQKPIVKLFLDSIDKMLVDNNVNTLFIDECLSKLNTNHTKSCFVLQTHFFDVLYSYSDQYYWFEDILSIDRLWKLGFPYYPKTKDCRIVISYIEHFENSGDSIILCDNVMDDLYAIVYDRDIDNIALYKLRRYLIELCNRNINNVRFLSYFLDTLSKSDRNVLCPDENEKKELLKAFCEQIVSQDTIGLRDYGDILTILPGKKTYQNDTLQRRFIEKGGDPLTISGDPSSYIYTKSGVIDVIQYSSFEDIDSLIEQDDGFLTALLDIVGKIPYFPYIAKLSIHLERHFHNPIIRDSLINKINQSYDLSFLGEHFQLYHIAALSPIEVSTILKTHPSAASHIPFHLQSYDRFISIARSKKSYIPLYFGLGNEDKGIEYYLDVDQLVSLLSINSAYIGDIKNGDIALKLIKAEFLWNT